MRDGGLISPSPFSDEPVRAVYQTCLAFYNETMTGF